jgi:glycosyltransferase involved in cell wall biosynthesis
MKMIMDFRKYDGVVGGVEQGVIQISKYCASHSHPVVLLCKEKMLDKVKTIFEGVDNLKIIPLPVDTHIVTKENIHLDSVVIQDIAESEGADIIHFFYNWSFPHKKKVPSVLTVHDVIPFTFREAQGFFYNLFKYKPSIRKACNLNEIIATVSEYSKQDISKKVGISLDKIHVIPNGLREPFPPDKDLENELKKKHGLDDRFILDVGGIHERKNIVSLIRAFSGLVSKSGYSGKLVITGKVTGAPYQEKMKRRCDRAVKDTGLDKKVIFTNFISEKELDSLFRMTDFLIYPSLYEGFGIPILEAMKMGTPVITSNVTAMPEVAGDAALYVDPYNVDEMTSAMDKLIKDKDLYNDLKQKGFKQAELFTWDRTAKSYIELYKKISG